MTPPPQDDPGFPLVLEHRVRQLETDFRDLRKEIRDLHAVMGKLDSAVAVLSGHLGRINTGAPLTPVATVATAAGAALGLGVSKLMGF